MQHGSANNNSYQIEFETTGTNQVTFRLNDGLMSHDAVGTVLNPESWHHIAATWDGATMRLYIDCDQIASTTFTGTIASESDPGRPGLVSRLGSRCGRFPNDGRRPHTTSTARVNST